MPEKPNKVELSSGRINVTVEGDEDTAKLMELASEQIQEQMRSWVEVDRQVVSTEPETVLFGGER